MSRTWLRDLLLSYSPLFCVTLFVFPQSCLESPQWIPKIWLCAPKGHLHSPWVNHLYFLCSSPYIDFIFLVFPSLPCLCSFCSTFWKILFFYLVIYLLSILLHFRYQMFLPQSSTEPNVDIPYDSFLNASSQSLFLATRSPVSCCCVF